MGDPPDQSDITFNHTSNVYLTRLSLYMWVFAALTYLIVDTFDV